MRKLVLLLSLAALALPVSQAVGAPRTSTAVPEGVTIIYAAGANQQAVDSLGKDDKNPNGLFARELVKAMDRPGRSVLDIFHQVRSAVITKALTMSHRQVPSIYDQATGDFYFSKAGANEKRIALVIGNDKYQHAASLQRAVADATAVRTALTKYGFMVTYLANANRSQLLDGFAKLRDSVDADTVFVLYYAGHGIVVDGENFLLPVEIEASDESDIKKGGLGLNDALEQLRAAKYSLSLIDSSREDPFTNAR